MSASVAAPSPLLKQNHMACPSKADLMNHNLGREVSVRLRAHIADCDRCRNKLKQMEDDMRLEIQDQASFDFALGSRRKQSPRKKSGNL